MAAHSRKILGAGSKRTIYGMMCYNNGNEILYSYIRKCKICGRFRKLGKICIGAAGYYNLLFVSLKRKVYNRKGERNAMDAYETAIAVMKELFSRDYQFALATAKDHVPSLRFVDSYFDGSCFYIVTYGQSQKVKEIRENSSVALCGRKLHSFSGKAYDIGHPLKPENAEIREKLIEVFENWYFRHNNEADENMCYVRIEPGSGFFHKNGKGYKVDFVNRTAEEFPFDFDIALTEE